MIWQVEEKPPRLGFSTGGAIIGPDNTVYLTCMAYVSKYVPKPVDPFQADAPWAGLDMSVGKSGRGVISTFERHSQETRDV